jgi:SAM-dependent methyltransferase
MGLVEEFYIDGRYHENNPDWDRADVDWKFKKLQKFIDAALNTQTPKTVCEIGCGSGDFLRKLSAKYPQHRFYGWDISPQAKNFWVNLPNNLILTTGDVLRESTQKYDLVLALDVIEHVADPIEFLNSVSRFSENFIFHIPIDLSAFSVIQDQKLLFVRERVGHIHYFTKNIALQLLKEVGFNQIQSEFTNAWKDSPQASQNFLARLVRSLIYFIFPEKGANIIGGQTLSVFCRKGAS